MEYFVNKGSIVREIWGKADTILFIFAGASAEFALNKSVDWLYFTGKLPADPIGRLFSTVAYARGIVFSPYEPAIKTIDKITLIHKQVEEKRSAQIPDWAYRDVLFMLIYYSIQSFELLERKLSEDEKAETFDVFLRVGLQMGIRGLPQNYEAWLIMRSEQLKEDLICSDLTIDLYKQYQKHLGFIRYQVLKQAQVLVVPDRVNKLLSLGKIPFLLPVLKLYKLSRIINMDELLKDAILPPEYKKEIKEMDINSA